ncbi:MAG TPA: hypothetical protein VIS05_02705, partial [Ilumatobacter sp.]
WHMVAKLLLAVQETYWTAIDDGAPDEIVGRLAEAYARIRAGLGFHKQPADYGAIPTDCYSHTPIHAGAQQPGMTGQVKEEVLTRLGELGVRVTDGRVSLSPGLLPVEQIVGSTDGTGRGGAASLTFCSVPMSITVGPADGVNVVRHDGTRTYREGLTLTDGDSRELLDRTGAIALVEWTVDSWRRRRSA